MSADPLSRAPLVRRRRWSSIVFHAAIRLATCLVLGLLVWMFVSIASAGLAGVTWDFLVAAPKSAGRAGGIAPILVSTLLILLVCLAAALPLGLGTAAFLAEFTREENRSSQIIRVSLDVLAGVPSIVFGLFGNAFFCRVLGLKFSIVAGGLTLACMSLPLLIRTIEAGLRSVLQTYRQAAAALGLSRSATFFRVTLPLAVPSIVTGLILAIGRALAETAAIIFTSGYVDRMPTSLLDSGRTLSIHIYDLAMNVPGGDRNACATAVVLVVALAVINSVAGWLAERTLSRNVQWR